jgi:hypothetical protein
VPAPHPGERTRHPVINKPSRHYAGTLPLTPWLPAWPTTPNAHIAAARTTPSPTPLPLAPPLGQTNDTNAHIAAARTRQDDTSAHTAAVG